MNGMSLKNTGKLNYSFHKKILNAFYLTIRIVSWAPTKHIRMICKDIADLL